MIDSTTTCASDRIVLILHPEVTNATARIHEFERSVRLLASGLSSLGKNLEVVDLMDFARQRAQRKIRMDSAITRAIAELSASLRKIQTRKFERASFPRQEKIRIPMPPVIAGLERRRLSASCGLARGRC